MCRSEERSMNLIEGLRKDLADRTVADNRKIKTAILGSLEALKQILRWKSINRFDRPPDFFDADLSLKPASIII
jgi:hypothetical protein